MLSALIAMLADGAPDAAVLPAGRLRAPLPIESPGTWVMPQDYPSSELARGVSGSTGFVLLVDTSGKVSDCRVTVSSGSTVLDATACALIKSRAKFRPGEDAHGEPIVGTYTSRVVWQMPVLSPLPLPEGKWDLTINIYVDEAGIVERCDFGSTGNEIVPPRPDLTPCSRFPAGLRMPVYKDASGKPVKVRVVRHETTEIVPR